MLVKQTVIVVLLSSLVAAMEDKQPDKPKAWSEQYRAAEPRITFELQLMERVNKHVHVVSSQQCASGHVSTENEIDLFLAVKENNITFVKSLLAAGVNVNAVEDGCTPLYFALRGRNSALARVLLAAGAVLRFSGKKLK